MYSRGCSLREVVLSRAKKIRLAMWKPQRQQLKKLTRTVRTNASSTEFRKGKHVSNQFHQRQPLFNVSICFPLGLSFSNQELCLELDCFLFLSPQDFVSKIYVFIFNDSTAFHWTITCSSALGGQLVYRYGFYDDVLYYQPHNRPYFVSVWFISLGVRLPTSENILYTDEHWQRLHGTTRSHGHSCSHT